MIARPYWITAQLAIVPRPSGEDRLDDERLALREAGIHIVVSMLEKNEAQMLGLEREATSAELASLGSVNFPIPDRGTPLEKATFKNCLENIEYFLANGKRVGIPSRASIGRSSVTAAGLLIRSGVPAKDAWLQISISRDCLVPDTEEQREWVDRHITATS
jgi:Polymorphic toxin system, DSP-PTPase phosphatase